MPCHPVYFLNLTLYVDSFTLMGRKTPDILNIHDRRNYKRNFQGKGNAVQLMQGCRCSFSLTLKICGRKEYLYIMLIMS